MVFAEGVSSIKAALRVGQPTLRRTVQRYARTIRQNVDLLRNSAAHTRAARLAHIDELLFGEKGNPEWNERRMFSKDTLDFFARVVKLYTTLGWPMDRGRAPRRPPHFTCTSQAPNPRLWRLASEKLHERWWWCECKHLSH